MRLFIIILLFFLTACNQNAQENSSLNTQSQNKTSNNNSVSKIIKTSKSGFYIDSVDNIKKGTNERSINFIKSRLTQLVGNSLKKICIEKGINYPAQFIVFRTFKLEGEFEIWGANHRSDSLQLLLTLPICAMDFEPGPKLEEGDGKTPEGYYNCSILYGSKADFMWIKLNNKDISTYGSVGKGSSFKICLDYPNSFDRLQTKKIKKHNSPGSAICVHGNCVSIGCISFKNKNYLPLFLFALGHNQNKYGKIKIYIYPFRFSEKLKKKYSQTIAYMNKKQLFSFWNNLEKGYNLFEKKHKALKISTTTTAYIYAQY